MRSSDARLSYMASREPLISSDGPKNSSHCTESSESERASPRPMLQKTGPQHRINRGGSSSSPRKPSAPFPTVRNNVKPFHSTGPQRPLAHSKFRPMRKQKLGVVRPASARAAPHRMQHNFRSFANTHMNTATRRCFLAQRTECETRTKQEQNFGARTPRQRAAAAVPCAGRQSVARGAPATNKRTRVSRVMKTFTVAPHAFATPAAASKKLW